MTYLCLGFLLLEACICMKNVVGSSLFFVTFTFNKYFLPSKKCHLKDSLKINLAHLDACALLLT